MIRYLTAGESHGPALVGIIDGLPAGMHVDIGALQSEVASRQGGHGRGARMKIEADAVEFLAGLRGGVAAAQAPDLCGFRHREILVDSRLVNHNRIGYTGEPGKRTQQFQSEAPLRVIR